MSANTKHTTFDQLKSLANRTKTELDKKQDTLALDGEYHATNNKVATVATVTEAVKGLSGAMHFIGTSTQDPTKETVTGTQDGPKFASEALKSYSPSAGDVVVFGTKEYLYDGTAWVEYGDEGSHAVKGSIANGDIASDAAIAQSKISGLTTDLGAKASKVAGESAKLNQVLTADANGDMQASGKKIGGAALATSTDADTDGSILATEKAVTTALAGKASTAVAVANDENDQNGSNGLMSAADKKKLDGFAQATDAEVTAMLDEVFA